MRHFYVHTRDKGTRAFHLDNGVKTAFMPNEPVLHRRHGLFRRIELTIGRVIRAYGPDQTARSGKSKPTAAAI